ncbi:MAG: hypothetical protein M3380_00745, partial [Chloroflexota bacterium]|nr:hypothetical protein [Chloroflexota bacterium]
MNQPAHCPYLGLRQNRAIRFATPTPEHRCYHNGTPEEIPVDQRGYCLSPNHVTCPLYTGQWDTFARGGDAALVLPQPVPAGRGMLAGLSSRDRAFYFALVTLVALIVAVWIVVGYLYARSLGSGSGRGPAGTEQPGLAFVRTAAPPAATATPTATPTFTRTPSPTATPSPSPSVTNTSTPTPSPTVAPPTATASPRQAPARSPA